MINQRLAGWAKDFQIQSVSDLDFVIGEDAGLPIGMQRSRSPEFRRRVLASLVSYKLGLRSIDYALKRYVRPDEYEGTSPSLGDAVSDYLLDAHRGLEEELKRLHWQGDFQFGIFGAELSLFRVPYALDTARQLSNRGLLLEVLPVLRLCLEMSCWASVAYFMQDEEKIKALKAQNCISSMKDIYPTVGRLYDIYRPIRTGVM